MSVEDASSMGESVVLTSKVRFCRLNLEDVGKKEERDRMEAQHIQDDPESQLSHVEGGHTAPLPKLRAPLTKLLDKGMCIGNY